MIKVVHLVTRILGNAFALYIASLMVSGFSVQGDYREYLLAGVALGLLNTVIKPVLKTISLPLIIITFGLFILVINGFLLWLVAYIFPFIMVANIYALIEATIIVALVNSLVTISAKLI